MGFVYGELQKAKQDIIEACKSKEAQYKPILDIIDTKSQGQLDSPLHLTAYLLNPFYFYKDQNIQNDSSIMEAVVECVERFYPEDVDAQDYVINKELLMYKNKAVFMPRRSGRNVGVREPQELHEEDFVSEDDSEEEGNEEIDFESDFDQVLEGYGGEELEEGDEL
ncbi:hypothetical protein RHGRI_023868 [Rhododendron griersonianum]|uniref:Uncharacterized protein n=1 Tax=Rhododendron griersonianum TaxID=479676 RepID=A0AAV6J759_9ERIC|nr:hypothetical protein RHGRI_023868 [Rhododendron griersonianum]